MWQGRTPRRQSRARSSKRPGVVGSLQSVGIWKWSSLSPEAGKGAGQVAASASPSQHQQNQSREELRLSPRELVHVANTHNTGKGRIHFRNPARSENIDKGPQGLPLWKLGSWEKEVRNQTQGHGAEAPRGRAGKPKGGELGTWSHFSVRRKQREFLFFFLFSFSRTVQAVWKGKVWRLLRA